MNEEHLNFRLIVEALAKIPEQTTLPAFESEIKLESRRMTDALLNALCQATTKKARNHIRQYQQGLLSLLSAVQKAIHASPAKTAGNKFRREMLNTFSNTIAENLQQLSTHFPGHFNWDSPLPALYWEQERMQLEKQAKAIFQNMTTLQIDTQITSFLQNIITVTDEDTQRPTYRQLHYWRLFLPALSKMFKNAVQKPGSLETICMLISLNLNHPAFYTFCCSFIQSEIQSCEDLTTQYKTSYLIKKCISQAAPAISCHHSPHLPPINTTLLEYMTAEITYLQSIDSIAGELSHQGLLNNSYKVTLTVKQLAIFIQLQVSAKIISPGSPKLLHEYISRHYSTLETSHISAKSFKNAYYSASTTDLEKVIDKLLTMLAIAQEKR
ncbi:hypothetical protein [Pedobacter sp. GR22-10]|uniref:hypothetical protein n=1 Tax=Pedobacter sp. GR22-10 TaxID=2994472 RepID=UPI002247EA28|nr:hypothetical protein [Pedobacter sp. GR22-10]MCX2429633.1 hypothetical protein [Pedobacter sp. GR22-10]